MFKRFDERDTDTVAVDIEGESVSVPAGASVAAAVLSYGLIPTRSTPVSGQPRAPFCMMGVCFDCLIWFPSQEE